MLMETNLGSTAIQSFKPNISPWRCQRKTLFGEGKYTKHELRLHGIPRTAQPNSFYLLRLHQAGCCKLSNEVGPYMDYYMICLQFSFTVFLLK